MYDLFPSAEVSVTDSILIVVYLLLVLTSIIEASSPIQKPVHSVAQDKSDLDIGLDIGAIRLQSQLPF